MFVEKLTNFIYYLCIEIGTIYKNSLKRYKVTGTINNKKDVLYATNSKSDGAVAFHWT